MINIDKDYLITVDLKNTKVKSDKTIFFYNTDLNICNIFIKLICTDEDKTIPEDLIVEFAVLKPETDEFKPLDATLISKEDLLYQVDLTTDYFDIVGKYSCEIRVSGTIENESKCFTSEEFDYVVRPNITAKLNKKIKNDKNLPILEKLIKDVKEITDGINKNEIQMKRDENLVGDNKTIVGAINQLREDVNSGIGGGTVDLTNYQKKNDEFLNTDEKTITGGINEVNNKIKKVQESQIELDKDDVSFNGIDDISHDTLNTTNKTLIGAINEVNTQCKDIVNLKNSTNVVNLEKYNITQADYTAPFIVENYNVAHQNGLGFQQAIDDAKEKNIQELIIPPGNYPLCYNASKKDERNTIINSEGIDIIANGCKFYVIYDEEGINPYYSWTDDELTANNNVKNNYLLMGYIFKTNRNIIGAEIIGERAYRQNENTKYRDNSCGIILSALSDNNIIKNCKIHHMSGDGISSDINFGVYNTTVYISGSVECHANNMVNGEIVSSVNSWLSPRMGIGHGVDTTKPTHICSTGYNYFLWTAKPLEIHCFTKDEVFIKTITVEQGNYFYLPNGTFYVYVTMYSGGTLTSDSKTNVDFRFGNAKFYGTTIAGCELYANQRGGISNPPSEVIIKNCCIHDNGGIYDGMVAYYDGTQFGLDIEDWYINRATIDSCLFYNNTNDILHRCHDLVIKNSTLKDDVGSLNYAVDIHFEHSNFYGNVTLNTPAQFGTKVALGCKFNGTVADEIQIPNFNEYQLPIATNQTLGGIKVGTGLSIINGVLNVTSSSGSSSSGGGSSSTPTESSTWKLLKSSTLEEDTEEINVNTDNNGNAFNIKEVQILIYPVNALAEKRNLVIYTGDTVILEGKNCLRSDTEKNGVIYIRMNVINNCLECFCVFSLYNKALQSQSPFYTITPNISSLTKFRINPMPHGKFGVGTEIQIYGR